MCPTNVLHATLRKHSPTAVSPDLCGRMPSMCMLCYLVACISIITLSLVRREQESQPAHFSEVKSTAGWQKKYHLRELGTRQLCGQLRVKGLGSTSSLSLDSEERSTAAPAYNGRAILGPWLRARNLGWRRGLNPMIYLRHRSPGSDLRQARRDGDALPL